MLFFIQLKQCYLFLIYAIQAIVNWILFHQNRYIELIAMKNTSTSKHKNSSSSQHSRKQSAICTDVLLSKIKKSLPIAIGGNKPLGSIQSTRLKSKAQSKPVSNMMSRRSSGQSKQQKALLKLSSDKQQKKNDHNRSNSTISKKSTNKQIKNSFKLDIGPLLRKRQQQQQNKIHFGQSKEISRSSFAYQYVIGKGGFGKVWSAQLRKTSKIYALKQMMKAKIIQKKSIHSVLNQRELLSKLKHTFLVNMSYAFQDRQHLYLAMDLLIGGDLRYYMGRRRHFKEEEAKFFIACILVGLQYLHLNNIIHRDIKPQNLVLDEKGYLRVTDLGIARIVKPNNAADTSGTPGYMAPQVMCKQDHSFPVDFYAVGVIAYEFMMGRRPYYGRDRKQIRDQILSKQVQVRAQNAPQNWSLEAIDFVNRMIQRKPSHRLGSDHGVVEIKDHPWFKNFPWVQLIKKTLPAPFIPKPISKNVDYLEQISETTQQNNDAQTMLLLRRKSVQSLFEEYTYFAKDKQKKIQSARDQRMSSMKNQKNLPTTSHTNTHNSNLDEKQFIQKKTQKLKQNNFFMGN